MRRLCTDSGEKKFLAGSEKSVKLTFVGYCQDCKDYRFLGRSNNIVTVSRDAKYPELGDRSEQPVTSEKSNIDDDVTGEIEIPINFEDGQVSVQVQGVQLKICQVNRTDRMTPLRT